MKTPRFVIFSFYSVLKNIYLILRKKKIYLNDNKKGTLYIHLEKYLITIEQRKNSFDSNNLKKI